MAAKRFTGTSGGGVVTATVTGSGELVAVDIDPSVLDPDDTEMVGDLVVAAVAQAKSAADDAAASTMGGLAGGLDIGGMLG